jgi:hypothetical protein
VEDSELDWLAAVKSNTLCVLPQAHEAEPEISFEALPGKIQGHQWPADSYGDPCTDPGVEQSCPD